MRERSKAKLIAIGILIPIILVIIGTRFLLNARPQTLEFTVDGHSAQITVTDYKGKKSWDVPVKYELSYTVDGVIADIVLQNAEATAYYYTFRIAVGVSHYNVTFFQRTLTLIHSVHNNIALGDSVSLVENLTISTAYTIAAEITVT